MEDSIPASIIMLFLILLLMILPVAGFVWGAVQDWKDAKNNMDTSSAKSSVIKTVYFYLVSLISLFMIVFASADLVNLALKTWVFPKADKNEYVQPPCTVQIYKEPGITKEEYDRRIQQCETSQVSEEEARAIRNQRDAVRDLAFLVVGTPLFYYHWRTIRRESRRES